MNNERRKQIENIKGRIAALLSEAENIKTDVEAIRDDEQEYRDNMPESFGEGEKGEKADAAIAALEPPPSKPRTQKQDSPAWLQPSGE